MEPLVLLPGMMCDARLWAPQIAALSAGRTMHLPCPAEDTVGAMAERVLADAPRTFALAGLSMGGIVAMEIVRRAPQRVTRLALLDTNPLAEAPEVAARRAPQMRRVGAGGLRQVMVDEMKPNYLAPGPGRAEVLDLVLAMAQALGPQVFVRQSRALQTRPDQTGTLRAVTVPALILCGAHDRLCPVSRHELMADLIAGARLVVLDDAGHLPTLETPDAVTAELRRWLAA